MSYIVKKTTTQFISTAHHDGAYFLFLSPEIIRRHFL